MTVETQSRLLSVSLVLADQLGSEHVDADELASTIDRFLEAADNHLAHIVRLPACVEAAMWDDAA